MEVYTEMSKSTGLYHDDLQLLNNHIDFEPNNNRMKIYRLPYERITIETIKAFKNLGRKKRCEKLIFYVNDYEKDMLTNDNNFVQEGFIAGFFQGDDAYVLDRKSTRLNSSHVAISYAVFCLKKKTR